MERETLNADELELIFSKIDQHLLPSTEVNEKIHH
jgi:hypothetical protein